MADNIGLRGPIRALSSNDPGFSVLRLMNRGKVKRVAVIAVDAEKSSDVTLDRKERPPNLVQTLGTVANAPMANYSFDTIELLRTNIENWNKDAANAPDLRPIDFYRVIVTFASLPESERKVFDAMPTSFSLTNAQVDALLKIGPRLLHESGDFERLLRDVH